MKSIYNVFNHLLIGICFTTASCAQSIDGTWFFDRSVNYEEPNAKGLPPSSTLLQILDSKLSLSPRCMVSLKPVEYYPGGAFQSLLKSGEGEPAIQSFLLNHFTFKLQDVKSFYQADPKMNDCNDLANNFLVSNDKLIAIHAGFRFYSYIRNKNTAVAESPPVKINQPSATDALSGLKPSQLPFNVVNYMGLCATKMQAVKGIPQFTSKCAPLYFPYVASRQSRDPLSKLVGAHPYQKGGAENESEDYNNPVANNLHPVFLVFPPMGDVVLVRVDDMEKAEERDPIRGAYISIKGGKVIDQLNEACSFDTSYLCSNGDRKPKFQLTETGMFRRKQ